MSNVLNTSRIQRNLHALAELRKKTPNPEILKRYTGWGGMRTAIFTPDIYRSLKQVCSDSEITSIKKTTSSAYYTPSNIIHFIYDALALLNRPFKKILEPSAGHGLFLDLMPTNIKTNSDLFAVELDSISCQFIQNLHPNVHLFHGGFETYQPKSTFDLIVGNPPYGREIVNDEQHANLASLRIHHYFVAKSMRLLEPGGVLAMVLPRYFMDNRQDHAREIIHREGGSLLAAYRLPDNLFSDAKVTVDVVFLIKQPGEKEWLFNDKIMIGGESAAINRYFSLHPNHVIGDLKIIEAYGRPELTCRQNTTLDTTDAFKQHLQNFPPKKLPSVDECKARLERKIFLLDKQINELSILKNQATQAKRDIDLMEQQFLKKCFDKFHLSTILN